MTDMILAIIFFVIGLRVFQFAWWIAYRVDKRDPWLKTRRMMLFNKRAGRIEFR